MAGKGRPFGEGNPGNMAGRPKGARNRTTVAPEKMFADEAQEITRTAIDLAKGGDTVALRPYSDRLMPARKDRPIIFVLPEIDTAADLTEATGAPMLGAASGEILSVEAAGLSRLVDARVRAIEAVDFAERLAALEQAAGGKRRRAG